MPNNPKDTIVIFDVAVQSTGGPGGRPLQARGWDVMVRASEQAVDLVQQNMTRFIKGVQSILADGAALVGAFQMDTVEVNAQITGEGKIGFAGTGATVEGVSSIKIVFKRKPAG